jgi:hypothetical protein
MDVKFEDLVGKTLVKIEGAERGSGRITLHTADESFVMSHSQDCCESVDVEDVVGDIADLIGEPILLAEEVVSENETPSDVSPSEDAYLGESYTWTFYKLRTRLGDVTLRWLGSSNGYYSESVNFAKAN